MNASFVEVEKVRYIDVEVLETLGKTRPRGSWCVGGSNEEAEVEHVGGGSLTLAV
jgi:hypothetical protein